MKKKKRSLFPLDAYILSALRRIWQWHPERKASFKEAEVVKNKVKFYRCVKCGEMFLRKFVRSDHIVPVVDPIKGRTSWDDHIARLMVTRDKLQIMCCSCHDQKSESENKIRRLNEKN